MGRRLLIGAAIAALGLWAGPARPQGTEAPPLVVRAGRIHTGTGEVLEGGVILIEGGRITAMGRDVPVPPGAEILEVPVAIPGLVDAHADVLLGPGDAEAAVAPDLRAADGIDPYADHRRELSGGVTSLYVAPGERRAVAGLGAVVKTAGPPERRLVRERAALEIRLGESPKDPPVIFEPPLGPSAKEPLPPGIPQLPGTRMGEGAILRALFAPEGPPPGLSPAAREVVGAAARGELLVRVTARGAADARRALDFAKAFGWKAVLVDVPDAARLAAALAEAKVLVVLSGLAWPGDAPPERPPGARDEAGPVDPTTAARLHAAGARVALHSTRAGDTPELLRLAAYAARQGLPADAALAAVTRLAADACGVGDRVGTLAVGRDGDVCGLDGEPFAAGTRTVATVVEGLIAWRRRPDPALAAPPTPVAGKPGAAPLPKPLVLRAGRFLTVGAGEVRGGTLVAVAGRIRGVGTGLTLPDGAETLDFPDATVTPGLLDAVSTLGIRGPDGRAPGALPGAALGTVAVPPERATRAALEAGITAVGLSPGAGGPVAGAIAVVKLAGTARVVRDPAVVVVEIGGGAIATRTGLEGFLKQARDYDQAWIRWETFLEANGGKAPPAPKPEPGKPPPPAQPKEPGKDQGMDGFRAVLRGERGFILRLDSPGGVRVALDVLGAGTRPLVPTLAGSGWLPTAFPDLQGARIRGVLFLPPLRGTDVNGRTVALPAGCAAAGIPWTLGTGGAEGTRDLPFLAMQAAGDGCPPDAVLRACTLDAARLLGVDDRLGSLETGKDCDCVVWSGDPLAASTRVLAVIVDGAVAYRAGP